MDETWSGLDGFGMSWLADDLRIHNHLLADRFLHASRALESSGSRQEFTPLVTDGTMSQKIALEDEARTHIMLAQDWNQLLKEIRCLPGFSNFLQPRQASSIMKALPGEGPIILINIHEDRCDALALIQGRDQPLHIPLEHLTYTDASELRIAYANISWLVIIFCGMLIAVPASFVIPRKRATSMISSKSFGCAS